MEIEELLNWDLEYIKANRTPVDRNGRYISSLDYAGQEVQDIHIEKLSQALRNNTTFQGSILLNSNLLTDQSVLSLSQALQRSGSVISELDLSYNSLTERSGVYIGNLLKVKPTISKLRLTGCQIGVDGVQRIFEAARYRRILEELDVGFVEDSGLEILAEALRTNQSLKRLAFQEAEGVLWGEEAKMVFLQALDGNSTLLTCEVTTDNTEEHAGLLGEVEAITARNRIKLLEHEGEDNRVKQANPQEIARNTAQDLCRDPISVSTYHLPVRRFLDNALGTLVNDGLFELMKFRGKEDEPSQNTAKNNLKWLARYLLDNSDRLHKIIDE